MSKSSFQIPGIWFCETCKSGNLPDTLTCRCGSARVPEICDFSRQISHGTQNPVKEVGQKQKRNGGTKESKLNKTELAALERIKTIWADQLSLVVPHGIKLFFPDRTSYTPDFVVYLHHARQAILIEVKGGYRGPGWEQGYERYKRARDLYHGYYAFQFWTKTKKEWEVTE